MHAQKCIKSGLVKLVGQDALLQRGSNVAAEMQTGGICAYVAMGGVINIYFVYLARSSDC